MNSLLAESILSINASICIAVFPKDGETNDEIVMYKPHGHIIIQKSQNVVLARTVLAKSRHS